MNLKIVGSLRFAIVSTFIIASQALASKENAIEDTLDPNTIHYEINEDSQHDVTNKLNGSIFFANNEEFYMDAETAQAKDSSGETSTTDTFEFDMTSDPNKKWGGGAGIKWFGLKNALTETTLRVPLHLKTKNWKFDLTPSDGTIKFTAQATGGKIRNLQVTDTSFELAVTYKGLKDWDLKLSTEQHQYGADLTKLNGTRASRVLSNGTRSLAQAFTTYNNSAELTYHFENADLGAMYSVSQSAFDLSLSRTTALNGEYFFNDSWSVNTEISQTDSNTINPATNSTYAPSNAATLGATHNFN